MKKRRIFNMLLFLVVGVLIFISIYRNLEFSEIRYALASLKYEWIILSGILGLTSHYIRALRWNLLIEPLSHKPGITNTYLAVLVLYLFNILIPRGGEFVRCTVINRYEKISFTRLLGTVVSERFSDLITFFLIVVVLIGVDISYFVQLLENSPRLAGAVDSIQNVAPYALVGLVMLAGILFLLFRRGNKSDHEPNLVERLFIQFRDGMRTIMQIRGYRKKGLFVLYTILIISLWLLMLYVVFFAYAPTSGLTLQAAVITFTISSFAFILPIQAGFGAWHFIVIQCLLLFGVGMEQASVFALVAHTFTNLVFLMAGTIAFVLLPVVNNRRAGDLKFRDIAPVRKD